MDAVAETLNAIVKLSALVFVVASMLAVGLSLRLIVYTYPPQPISVNL